MKKLLFSFLIFLLSASTAQAASVTVCDTGNGCNYTSIDNAMTAIQSGVANTITVKSPYSGNERVTVSKSGASNANRLIITADTGYTPKTKGFTVSGSYVTVNGFEMTGCTSNMCAAWSGNYVTFTNNNIHGSGTALYTFGQPSDNYVEYGVFSNNKVHDGSNHYIGYVLCNNCTFDSNEIYNFVDADNLYFWGHDSVYSNNYVHDLTYSNGVNHSDMFQTCCGMTTYNWVFEKNLFVGSGDNYAGANACVEGGASDPDCADQQPFTIQVEGGTMHDIIIRNNIFLNFGGSANVGVANTSIINNTFINCGWVNMNVINPEYIGGGSSSDDTGLVIKNNLFLSATQSTTEEYAFTADARTTHSNNYVGKWTGSAFAAFSGWSETGGVYGSDPKLANVTLGHAPDAGCNPDKTSGCYITPITCGTYNFTTHTCSNFDLSILTNSPLKDVGANLTSTWSNATDIIGTSRPQGSAWDIGAYEFEASVAATGAAATIGSGAAVTLGSGAVGTLY